MIYLDNNATTRVDEQVRQAMEPWLAEHYGNPSSLHRFGQESRQAIELARHQVAELLSCAPGEIVFTSGGTESDNAAIMGVVDRWKGSPRRIVTSTVEHSAVREPIRWVEKQGHTVTEIPVDTRGNLDIDALRGELAKGNVGLVSIMWANNETGVIFDIAAIAQVVREASGEAVAAKGSVVFHVDAVQAAGKIPLKVAGLGVDLLSVSGHKFHGPKGVGALYVRRGAAWSPFMRGGPQERERRGGTENVPAIVGIGAAAQLARAALAKDPNWTVVRALRDRLERGLLERIPETFVNGDPEHRLANTTNIGFAGLEAESILLLLSEQGVCASAGAACASGSLEPSHVIQAMGIPERIAHGAVRFSLSSRTTAEEIEKVLEIMPPLIARLRAVM